MKIRYSKDVDAMYISLDKGDYEISEEIGDGIIMDFSKKGSLIGMEILDASERFSKKALKKMLIDK